LKVIFYLNSFSNKTVWEQSISILVSSGISWVCMQLSMATALLLGFRLPQIVKNNNVKTRIYSF